MIALAFGAIAFGAVLLVAGVTGSSIASAATGHPDHKNATSITAGKTASSPSAPASSPSSAPAGSSKLGKLLGVAREEIGTPYAWGGELGKIEFDCSGLVQYAARKAGISLPRTAQQQFNAVQKLSPGEAGAGDLVFFTNGREISHVGIIVAPGRMIDAPHTGASVREESFTQQIGALWGGDHVAGFGRP